MPMKLSGSCRCGSVAFTVDSNTPYPYQLCYCSICRKTTGGGGFSINIMGIYSTLKVEGKECIGVYQAEIEDENGSKKTSECQRSFCKKCATALWAYDNRWPELIHPLASVIDTELPKPPHKVHILLDSKAEWVVPDIKPCDKEFSGYPEQSIEDWHKKLKIWID